MRETKAWSKEPNKPMALPDSLHGLMHQHAYPHPCGRIELIETHISWVLLTGDFAYKLKKPVRFSFLGFSTLELREHFCREELRCNRRFAPELYLDVVPGQVGAGLRYQRSKPRNKVFRFENQVRGAVAIRRLQRVAHVPAAGQRQPAGGDRRT